MGQKYLNETYDLLTPEDTRAHYDTWSDSYDTEVADNGYATPGRIAAALRKHATPSYSVLDFGCGTGLCGEKLKQVGFKTIDGADLSSDMIEKARAKGVYRNLWQVEADAPQIAKKGSYGAVTACGVIGMGAAPIDVFDHIMGVLGRGGLFAFSFNDHTLKDRSFEAKVMEHTDCGSARLLLREHGPHLPGINLKSMIYVIEKN